MSVIDFRLAQLKRRPPRLNVPYTCQHCDHMTPVSIDADGREYYDMTCGECGERMDEEMSWIVPPLTDDPPRTEVALPKKPMKPWTPPNEQHPQV